MEGIALIQEAESAGITLHIEYDELVVIGPRRLERLAQQLLDDKPVVLAALSARCAQCHRTAGRVVKSYWGPSFCPECRVLIAAKHDRDDSWPKVPWADGEVSGTR